MDSFNVKDFCRKPDSEVLQSVEISKDDWKFIARFFDIEYSSSHTKAQIRTLVIDALVEQGQLPVDTLQSRLQSATSELSITCSDNLTVCQELPGETIVTQTEDNVAISEELTIPSEGQIKLEYKKLEERKAEREWERENFRLMVEEEENKHRRMVEEEENKHRRKIEEMNMQLRLAEIQGKSSTFTHPTDRMKWFDVSKNSVLVGSFDEKDPESFFDAFEKLAKQLDWDPKYWTVLIQTKFTGKARQVYNHLSSEESQNYELVKKTIMIAYDQVQETYRQRFRGLYKSQNNTYVEFADDLVRLFDQWLKSAGVNDYLSLKNLMLLDQFRYRVPPDLRVYLEEREIRY